jgi:dihydroneopterin aldolase
MSDRITLHDMVFQGRHGVHEHELTTEQPFHVDVDLQLDLHAAGVDDDLARTVDYAAVYDLVRGIVESTSYRLIEALAEAIAHEILAGFPVDHVTVRVRKPGVDLGGPLAWAGVEIRRGRRPG